MLRNIISKFAGNKYAQKKLEKNIMFSQYLSGIGSGSSFQGDVIVNKIEYSTPRYHYYSIGGEHFQPLATVDYVSGGGCGGAYLISGEGKLVASVNLPDGATIDSWQEKSEDFFKVVLKMIDDII